MLLILTFLIFNYYIFNVYFLLYIILHASAWWNYGDNIPILKKYAMRILCQHCTSSSYGRNWSAFKVAQTKKRNKLTPEMPDNLVYARMNTFIIETFEHIRSEWLKPINLEKLNNLPAYVDLLEDEYNVSFESSNGILITG